MMWKAFIEKNSDVEWPKISFNCHYHTWSVILRFNGSPPMRSNWINAIRNAFPGTEIRNNRLPKIIISDMLSFESSELNSICEEFISQKRKKCSYSKSNQERLVNCWEEQFFYLWWFCIYENYLQCYFSVICVLFKGCH